MAIQVDHREIILPTTKKKWWKIMSFHCNVYVMVYQDTYNASLIPFFPQWKWQRAKPNPALSQLQPNQFSWPKVNNPLHPNISMHILHTVLHTFPKVLIRRICSPVKSFFSWWSFPLFSWPLCVIQGCYCKEKVDVSRS